ncbi:hypothetical protein VTN77DRAFT_9422 [Rasamsonia byssochlamydoides]|uniref:uncharacterized protein n=1 Tax=Rasamsonia byssochlamydoides TaxID=89139 RepID=UPI00374442A7
MPALTLHLLALKDTSSIDPKSFVKRLSESPNLKVIVASRPRHVVIYPTIIDVTPLATQQWDLMVLLQQTQTQENPTQPIPEDLRPAIRTEYRILVGVPSKLLATYPERDAALKREAFSSRVPLTGSLEKKVRQGCVGNSSQNLEVSPRLLAFMDELSREHGDRPVTMLNLLNFRHPGGKESYFQYGQAFIPVAGKRGGSAKLVGSVVKPSSAISSDSRGDYNRPEQDWWNEISIVHYPSIGHFCDMLAGDDYQAINEKYRLKALRDTFLLCTTEFDVEETNSAKL